MPEFIATAFPLSYFQLASIDRNDSAWRMITSKAPIQPLGFHAGASLDGEYASRYRANQTPLRLRALKRACGLPSRREVSPS